MDIRDIQAVTPEGKKAVLTGAVLALVVYLIPFARFVMSYLGILIHELGHAIFAWLFGYPAIPAFDFSYGGGVTIHIERNPGIVLAVVCGLGFLFYLFRRNRYTLKILAALAACYLALAVTRGHEMLQVFMGHGMELVIAGVFLFRAIKGGSITHQIERPLYAFCGFFIFLHDIIFAFTLALSQAARNEYGDAKGGGHWMDFSRLGEEYTGLGLPAVSLFFICCCLAAPLLSYLIFRYESPVAHRLERILRLS